MVEAAFVPPKRKKLAPQNGLGDLGASAGRRLNARDLVGAMTSAADARGSSDRWLGCRVSS